MKRILVVTLSLFLITAGSALAAEGPSSAAKAAAGGKHQLQIRQVDDPTQDIEASFPTVSVHQMPGIVPNVGCNGGEGGDPCQNDWGDGGWTQGGCNCSRTCDGVCKPIGNNQCQAPNYGGGCDNCVNGSCP